MPTPLDFQLVHASIVLVASQAVSPESVTAEALKRNKIIPEDWQITTEMNLPVIGLVQFDNGASIRTEGNRCVFQQNVNGEFAEDYLALDAAVQYAEASRVVPYSAVGINWMMQPDLPLPPSQWLAGKLCQDPLLAPGFQPTSIRVAKRQGSAVCNLNFNFDRGIVSLECNYHIELGGKSAHEIVTMWPHYQMNLRRYILPTIAR